MYLQEQGSGAVLGYLRWGHGSLAPDTESVRVVDVGLHAPLPGDVLHGQDCHITR